MGLEIIDKLYTSSDFTALTEHNAETPASFFEGPPVLHLACSKSTVVLAKDALDIAPDLAALKDGSEVAEDGTRNIEDVDVWVTSRFFILSSKATGKSLRIDYPTIVVHAQTGASVMMVLRIQDDEMSDEDDCAQINILPSHAEGGADPAELDSSTQVNGDSGKHYAMLLYQAIGACQELNPDPETNDDNDDGEDDLQATGFPAGDWITSDNIHEFTDEQGNFRTPAVNTEAALGPGAGSVRPAADDEADEDDSKWQRTG